MSTETKAGPVPELAESISGWIVEQGILGTPPEDLLAGLSARLNAQGFSIQRMHTAYRALHPVYGSRGIDWIAGHEAASRTEYARQSAPLERWVKSPFYHLLESGQPEFRQRLSGDGVPHRFPVLDEFQANGGTDYFAVAVPFGLIDRAAGTDPNNPSEGVTASWTCNGEGGFADHHIEVLRSIIPSFALALKAISNRQLAADVVTTYLGTDAGRRVLSGEIERGSVETLNAVICCFDLQGFTRISETVPGSDVIAMLDDYFAAVVAIIESHHGNVLKFMGDGLLATFAREDHGEACTAAITASREIRKTMASLGADRSSRGLPHTSFTLSLHAGDVLYGNIGGERRLDFTVIGPAVNAAARIQSMCGDLDEDILISAQVADAVPRGDHHLVSVGRYKLRGIADAMDLYAMPGV